MAIWKVDLSTTISFLFSTFDHIKYSAFLQDCKNGNGIVMSNMSLEMFFQKSFMLADRVSIVVVVVVLLSFSWIRHCFQQWFRQMTTKHQIEYDNEYDKWQQQYDNEIFEKIFFHLNTYLDMSLEYF